MLDRDDMVHIGICTGAAGRRSTEQVMEHAEAAALVNAALQGK